MSSDENDEAAPAVPKGVHVHLVCYVMNSDPLGQKMFRISDETGRTRIRVPPLKTYLKDYKDRRGIYDVSVFEGRRTKCEYAPAFSAFSSDQNKRFSDIKWNRP